MIHELSINNYVALFSDVKKLLIFQKVAVEITIVIFHKTLGSLKNRNLYNLTQN
jgi:hypothetical protein